MIEHAVEARGSSMILEHALDRRQITCRQLRELSARSQNLPYSARQAVERSVEIDANIVLQEAEILGELLRQQKANEEYRFGVWGRAAPVFRQIEYEQERRYSSGPSYPMAGLVTSEAPLDSAYTGPAVSSDIEPEGLTISGIVCPLNSTSIMQREARSGKAQLTEGYGKDAFTRYLRLVADGTENVHAYLNHDPNHILGCTRAGTLQLRMVSEGLAYRVSLCPEVESHRALWHLCKRGDAAGASLGFHCLRDRFFPENGVVHREIQDADIVDCSVVASPAYKATTAIASGRVVQPQRRSFPAATVTQPVASERRYTPPPSGPLVGSVRWQYDREREQSTALVTRINRLAQRVGLQ